MLRLGLVLLCMIWFSCQNETKTKENKHTVLFEEIMTIHDAVMPRTEDIYRLKRQLIERKALLKENIGKRESIETAIARLTRANDMMMDWMNEFNADYENLPNAEILPYLKQEKIKIEAVSDSMLQSLENGQKLLQN